MVTRAGVARLLKVGKPTIGRRRKSDVAQAGEGGEGDEAVGAGTSEEGHRSSLIATGLIDSRVSRLHPSKAAARKSQSTDSGSPGFGGENKLPKSSLSFVPVYRQLPHRSSIVEPMEEPPFPRHRR